MRRINNILHQHSYILFLILNTNRRAKAIQNQMTSIYAVVSLHHLPALK